MKIILYTLALSLASMSVYADTVTLKNGDRITGSIVRKEDSNLVFMTSFAGEIKLKWTEISALKTDKPVVLVLDNDTSIEGANLEPTTTGSAGVRTANIDQPMDIALASVKYINPSIAISGKGVKVTGRVNVGASIASGNTDTESYAVDTEVIMRTKTNRTTVGANAYKAKDDGVATYTPGESVTSRIQWPEQRGRQ